MFFFSLKGIHFKGKFDLGCFKTISYQSEELQKRLRVSDAFAYVTFKRSHRFAMTFPINTEGQFVTHIYPQDENAQPEELVKELIEYENIPYKIVFSNSWQGHFACAETFQVGRVFLAGNYVANRDFVNTHA